jgi:hypothetical protein
MRVLAATFAYNEGEKSAARSPGIPRIARTLSSGPRRWSTDGA